MITPRTFEAQKPRKTRLQRGGIKPVSSKRIKINAIYARLREKFLQDHPYDQVVMKLLGVEEADVIAGGGMTTTGIHGAAAFWPRSNEIHHVKGRGKYLLDITTWLAVRSDTHQWIHANPKESYEKGFMQPRN